MSDDESPKEHISLRVETEALDGYRALLKRYKATLKYGEANLRGMLAQALKNHLPYFAQEVAAREQEKREREGGTDQVTPRGGDPGDS